MKALAGTLGIAVLLTPCAAVASERESVRLVAPFGIEMLDVSNMNAKLATSGIDPLPRFRMVLPPLLGLQFGWDRWVFTSMLLRAALPVTADGPGDYGASLWAGRILEANVGWIAHASNGYELMPFAGFDLGVGVLTVDGRKRPPGVFPAQSRFEVPLRVGLRLIKTIDTFGDKLFGYAEPRKQGAGPVIGLEVGAMTTAATPWADDDYRSNITGGGSAGVFVNIVLGFGAWHAGRGPW